MLIAALPLLGGNKTAMVPHIFPFIGQNIFLQPVRVMIVVLSLFPQGSSRAHVMGVWIMGLRRILSDKRENNEV